MAVHIDANWRIRLNDPRAALLITLTTFFRYADFVASVVHAGIFIARDDGVPAVSMNNACCHIVMVSGWMHQMVKVSTLVMGKSILFV